MSTRVAIITGGTRGLGLGIAKSLLQDGLRVALIYKSDQQKADEVVGALSALSGAVTAHQVDVTNEVAVSDFCDNIVSSYGSIDILVHGALKSGKKPLKTHELEPASFQEDLAVNLFGAFVMTRFCLPHMLQQKWGRIIYLGSLAMRGERGRVSYSTAKNGIVGLAKTVAQEYARDGITANVVSPGYIESGAFLKLNEQIKHSAKSKVPVGRLGTEAEVANAVKYFVSEDSGFTTGQVLHLNGGMFTG
ncbi:MAG: SDR family NAD(P)-dependent oxidoreductase [Myxococcota bacterium]|nr:SDR family NAD(P)-dependent oxidoreductase [Myxococcota bacterium]